VSCVEAGGLKIKRLRPLTPRRLDGWTPNFRLERRKKDMLEEKHKKRRNERNTQEDVGMVIISKKTQPLLVE